MKRTYSIKHFNFLDALGLNKNIRIKKNNYLINPKKDQINQLMQLNLNLEILEFYNQIQDIKISWKYNGDSINLNYLDKELDFVEGEFNQVALATFLKGIEFR